MARTKAQAPALVGELMPHDVAEKQLAISEARRRAALANTAFIAHAGTGRKPGAKNRVGKKVRETVLNVFDRLGGEDAFLRWARENRDMFYKFYMRMMPQEDKVAPNQLTIMMLRGDDKL